MPLASAYSEADLATLERMRRENAGPTEIARALGRTKGSVNQRIERLELQPFYAARAWEKTLRPDPAALAEREQRLALAPRDLTAEIFGDPLPGYSALEKARR